jgi:hypothetical protein
MSIPQPRDWKGLGFMIPDCKQLPFKAEKVEGERYQGVKVYAVPLTPGLFRSIPRDRRSGINTPVENAVVCHDTTADKLVELVPWQNGVDMLSEFAGMVIPEDDTDGGENTQASSNRDA